MDKNVLLKFDCVDTWGNFYTSYAVRPSSKVKEYIKMTKNTSMRTSGTLCSFEVIDVKIIEEVAKNTNIFR